MAPERVVGHGEMAWSVSAPSVPTPEAQRREEIARAIHEGWHDPGKPGHGVLQPEDYACADLVLALPEIWLAAQAQQETRMTPTPSAVAAAERILADTPHAGIDYPELRHRIAFAPTWQARASALEEAAKHADCCVDQETLALAEKNLVAHADCHPAALCDGPVRETERLIRFLTLGLPDTHTWTVAEIKARAAAAQETL